MLIFVAVFDHDDLMRLNHVAGVRRAVRRQIESDVNGPRQTDDSGGGPLRQLPLLFLAIIAVTLLLLSAKDI